MVIKEYKEGFIWHLRNFFVSCVYLFTTTLIRRTKQYKFELDMRLEAGEFTESGDYSLSVFLGIPLSVIDSVYFLMANDFL